MRGGKASRLAALALVFMLSFAHSAFAVGGIKGTLWRGNGGAMNNGSVRVEQAPSNVMYKMWSPQLLPEGASNGIDVTVHLSNGTPVSGMPVYIWEPSGESWRIKPIWKSTTADGSWEATLAPGTYKVQLAGKGGSLASAYWTRDGLTPFFSSADTVTVSVGVTATVDATAAAAATISGSIHKFDGSDIPTAVVTPYAVNPATGLWEELTGTMAYDGSWSMNTVLPGTYRFRFESTNPRYAVQFWNVKPSLLAADGVTLAGGQNATGYDVVMRTTVASDSVAGVDRMDTAVQASKRLYPSAADHADAVILTTGYNWPDALGASALAGAAKAPILLTFKGERSMTATVSGEIARLKANGAVDAYVLGDENAVGASVFGELVKVFGSTKVHRLAGKNRYETSLQVAAEVRAKSKAWEGKVFLARGDNFADALAASPVAAQQGWPIVLAEGDGAGGLSLAVRDFLSENASAGVVILGNDHAIAPSVQAAAQAAVGTATVERWAGDTRFETAIDVADHAFGLGMSQADLGIATGYGYADALCGGPYLAKLGSPLFLVDPRVQNDAGLALVLKNEFGALSPDVLTVHFFGGLPTLPQPLRDTVVNRLQ